MLNNKTFYLILRSSVLLIWIVLIILAVTGGSLAVVGGVAFLVMLLLHMAELPISMSIGREKKLETRRVVFKTLVYGFTWWLPLRKGIIDE